MSKVLLNLILFTYLVYFPTPVFATAAEICSNKGITLNPDKKQYETNSNVNVTVNFTAEALKRVTPDWEYTIAFLNSGRLNQLPKTTTFLGGSSLKDTQILTLPGGLDRPDAYTLVLTHKGTFGFVVPDPDCTGPTILVLPAEYLNTKCTLSLPKNIQYSTSYPVPDIELNPKNIQYDVLILGGNMPDSTFKLDSSMKTERDVGWGNRAYMKAVYQNNVNPNTPQIQIPSSLPIGNYTLVVVAKYLNGSYLYGCNVSDFNVWNDVTDPNALPRGAPKPALPGAAILPPAPICSTEEGSINPCSKGGGLRIKDCGTADNPAIATAIGCIHTSPVEFVKDLMKFVIGIGGGLAFLMMLLGAFQMLTSAGNPETLKAGQDRLTSAVIGLLFVIFTILLLQIVGIGILNIPGFKP